MKITKDSNIGEIIANYPDAAKIITGKYNLHCMGCVAANFETIEAGAKAHGMDNKQIEMLIKDINEYVN